MAILIAAALACVVLLQIKMMRRRHSIQIFESYFDTPCALKDEEAILLGFVMLVGFQDRGLVRIADKSLREAVEAVREELKERNII